MPKWCPWLVPDEDDDGGLSDYSHREAVKPRTLYDAAVLVDSVISWEKSLAPLQRSVATVRETQIADWLRWLQRCVAAHRDDPRWRRFAAAARDEFKHKAGSDVQRRMILLQSHPFFSDTRDELAWGLALMPMVADRLLKQHDLNAWDLGFEEARAIAWPQPRDEVPLALVARQYRVSKKTLLRHIQKGLLKARREGTAKNTRYWVSRADVENRYERSKRSAAE